MKLLDRFVRFWKPARDPDFPLSEEEREQERMPSIFDEHPRPDERRYEPDGSTED
jgi:hypothetical protein